MSRKVLAIVAAVTAVVFVLGAVWYFVLTPSTDAAYEPQWLTSTTTSMPASTALSTTQVPSQPAVTASSESAGVDTGSPMVPHLQPGQELPPTPIQGLNVPIDGVEWSIMDPADSMDDGLNRMTKVNRVPIAGSDCTPSVTTRFCTGFIVVSTDQTPFYKKDGCLSIGAPGSPSYKFSRRLDDVKIDGMVVERVQMERCGAPGASFVWRFPLKDGTKVDVIEVGNDSAQPSNPLKGLTELLDKVTLEG